MTTKTEVIKVRVVALLKPERLIVIPDEPSEGLYKEWWPINGKTCGGSVLGDSLHMLACSREALAMMKKVKPNRDAIGDIDWWKCDNGRYAFSWWGPLYRVIDPKNAEAARGFSVYTDKCTVIPNDVPPEAKLAIEKDEKLTSWREPIVVDYPGPGHGPDKDEED